MNKVQGSLWGTSWWIYVYYCRE